jgi:hypothetical protein
VTGAAFGLPPDMPRCDLCDVALWTWWETRNGAGAWCTSCAQLVSLERVIALSSSPRAGRRRNAG